MAESEFTPTPELLAKLSTLLPSTAWTSTVPILVMVGETLTPHATGTLLRVADAFFLVTAAHVLEMAPEHKAKVTIGATGHKHPLQIGGSSFKADDDALDIAIWRLDQKSVGFLSNNTFLMLADVFTPDQFEDDVYFVCGFPCAHSTSASAQDEIAQSAPLEFGTFLYDGDLKDAPGYNPEYHVLLSAGRDYLYKGKGADRDFPDKVFGLSGCPIWKTKALHRPQETWKAGQAKLVAVQTCAYPKGKVHKILRGTTWKAVGSLIVAVYPELRPSFDFYHR